MNKIVGFINEDGKSCYFNSILQALLLLNNFVNELKSSSTLIHFMKNYNVYDKEEIKETKSFLIKMIETIEIIDNKNNIPFVISVSNLLFLLKNKSESIKENIEQDAEECLLHILNNLHIETRYKARLNYDDIENELKNILIKYDSEKIKEKKSKTYVKLNYELEQYKKTTYDKYVKYKLHLFWQNHLQTNFSIVGKCFDNLYFTELQCIRCKNINIIIEASPIIKLNIIQQQKNKSLTLFDCLNTYILPEEISANCSNCKKEQHLYKKINICKFSKILIINFNRFIINGLKRSKNDSDVIVPFNNVDLTDYATNTDSETRKKYVYNLKSFVVHTGDLNNGHYITYGRFNNKWYQYNDEQIGLITPEKINFIIAKANKAYILFYERI